MAAYDPKGMREYLRTALTPLLERLDLDAFSLHNAGYRRYGRTGEERFRWFVEAELGQVDHLFRWAAASLPEGTRLLDVGCLVPVIPAGLARLGFRVSTVEKTSLYGGAFDPIRRWCDEQGIGFHDLDVLSEADRLPTFPVICLINVLEHLNGSPKGLLAGLVSRLEPGGALLVSVPNVASIYHRAQLLRGRSPFPPFEDYWSSAYPFAGHNREYTADEARRCLEDSGLVVESQEMVAAHPVPGRPLGARLLGVMERWGPRGWRNVVFTRARRQEIR